MFYTLMNDYASRLVHLWNASYLSNNLKYLTASYKNAPASLHLNTHYLSTLYFYVALNFLSHYHIKRVLPYHVLETTFKTRQCQIIFHILNVCLHQLCLLFVLELIVLCPCNSRQFYKLERTRIVWITTILQIPTVFPHHHLPRP